MKRFKIKNKRKFNRFIILVVLTFTLLLYMLISLVLPNMVSGISQEKSFTVLRGDNLWDIAEALDTGRDTRQVIYDIYKLNNISDSQSIYPGQVLKLPLY
ncbi:MAG: LysM domain-containing protein [Tissierellia bacterium]|nr:LysM domain-containing protein [Tissierellia bacterium]